MIDINKKQNNFNIINLEHVQKILDALPFYVLLVDENHKVLLANDAVRHSLGLEPEHIVDKYCPEVVHGSNKPIPHCPLESAVSSGQAIEVEYFDHMMNKWNQSAIYPTGCKTDKGQTVYFHMVRDINDRKDAEEKLRQSLNKLKKITESTINAMTLMVEKRDPYTAGHQQYVSKLAYYIAKEMNLPDEQVEGVRIAGLVHDIGKVGIPIEILCKPGRIEDYEMNIIKNHPVIGFDIVKEIEFPWPVAKAILQHHERINGSGYPNGLLNKDIILEAKILSVADVVEAMHSHRPYRPALGLDKAVQEISKHKGILYDPEVVDACLNLFTNKGFYFE